MAVLIGANSRTYKFALGSTLLELARRGQDEVSFAALAAPYAMQLVQRAQRYPQGPTSSTSGPSDFLTVLSQESAVSQRNQAPTERLVDAAVNSMPQMVMQKFHNLRGMGEVPHRFYEIHGRGSARRVILTSDVHSVATHEAALRPELNARWSIVEACFDAEIGRQLVSSGIAVSADGCELLAPARRVTVTGAREALTGFQHGRCFYCHESLAEGFANTHVDHVYPFSLMKSGIWTGPDLNGVWNLVVACAPCNLAKSARLPQPDEVTRLLERNDAIVGSPHPLRRALQLSMRSSGTPLATSPESRRAFVRNVDLLATDRGLG